MPVCIYSFYLAFCFYCSSAVKKDDRVRGQECCCRRTKAWLDWRFSSDAAGRFLISQQIAILPLPFIHSLSILYLKCLNKTNYPLIQLKAARMENSPRLCVLLYKRMHQKFRRPTKASLLLKSGWEKQRFQENTHSLRNEDSLIPLLQLWTFLWNEATPKAKVRRSQDGNPIGINTVENTLAICCSCGFLKMCANFQWKLNVHIKKKKNPNL